MSQSKQRIAIIDIGSNTIKLLVADFENGALDQTVLFESDDTRIGGFLGGTSSIMPDQAIVAGSSSVQKLLALATPLKPDHTAIVATSAVRDAINRQVFCDHILSATGYPVALLSGPEEAEAIALGARCDPKLTELREFYMLDQGGGSLEIIHWSETSTELVSLPLGAVRLFKQFQHGKPGLVIEADRTAIHEHIRQQWDSVPWLKSLTKAPWIGTGGALSLIRSLLAERQGQELLESSNSLDLESLSQFYSEIAAMSIDERMSLAGIPSSRADILPAGLLAVLEIMDLAGAEKLTHSIYNLRYGYAAKLATSQK